MSESLVRPVLVIGVSGATWDVLRPLMQTGRTPCISRLLERGCGATLTSVKAPGDRHFRPQVAWPSIATGCLPERHGVTRFFHEAQEVLEPALWDIFAQEGLSSGIYGWPGTWPPKPIKGFIVPSHLARDTRTWPPSLSDIKALDRWQQLSERGGGVGGNRLAGAISSARILTKYGLRPQTLAAMAGSAPSMLFGRVESRRLLLRRTKLEMSVDMFIRLARLHQTSFSAFVTFYVDFVSHRYWRYRNPELFETAPNPEQQLYASAVDDAYVALDRAVGRLVTAVGDHAVIALVSEHGMAPEPVSAEMGAWHYLIRASRVRELAGLDERLEPCPVARWVAFRPVDAVSSASVAERLRRIEVLETGLPLFRVYEHRDEVVIKLALDNEVPRYATGDLESLTVRIGGQTVPFTEIARRFGRQRSAMHAADGILVLAGPNIRRGSWLPSASVLDVAPTLLRAAGLACDARFDGRLLDVFERGPP